MRFFLLELALTSPMLLVWTIILGSIVVHLL